MKKFVFIIPIIAFYLLSPAQGLWSIIHPYPTSSDLIDAHFVSEQKGWVVGTRGLIMYTEDGCETWEIQHSDPDEALWSVFFIDDTEGWAVGWSEIYHTTDAGTTWEQQTRPYVLGDLMDVYFLDHDTGWIVGRYQIILKTTDGGDNWTKISNILADNISYHSVSFTDGLHGCAVGGSTPGFGGVIMVTDDGGFTWTETTPSGDDPFYKVIFIDADTGWVCGNGGALMKTIDGGYTWIDKSYTNSYFKDIHFFDNMHGILFESSDAILTFDGGESWDSTVNIGATSSIRGTSSWGYNGVITVGFSNSMSKTTDGGVNWDNLNNGTVSSIYQIGFFDAFNGLAVTGTYNTNGLIRTTDGGYNWHTDTLIENGPFYLMKIYDQSCYLLNSSSQMMKTTNGGEEWDLLEIPPVSYEYYDMQFLNENTGYMCALEGKFVKTIDGGVTWLDKSLSNNYVLEFLLFINEDTGFIINSDARTILRTKNGGDDWTISYLSNRYNCRPKSISFINENEGFASTHEGFLFKTINCGDTWEEFYTLPGSSQSEILFVDETEGWYKAGATIFHTIDGGESWVSESYFGKILWGMFFLDNTKGWLGGEDGFVATYDLSVGINEFNRDFTSVSVFPNPAFEYVTVKLYDESDKINDVKVFNLHGQYELHFSNLHNSNSFKFNISDLISGTYVLQITSANTQNLVKFIKQ